MGRACVVETGSERGRGVFFGSQMARYGACYWVFRSLM